MYPWPELDLTDHERKFVRYYAAGGKPGVLRRTYRNYFSRYANTHANIAAPQFADRVQISRRARIFALSFVGDTSAWFLNIRTASGEMFTPPNPANTTTQGLAPGCLVSSMLPGATWDAQAGQGSYRFATNNSFQDYRVGILALEPNIVMAPNETLFMEGTLAPAILANPDDTTNYFLSIGIHVWEFPDMSGR